jgi:hypothetical protein
MTSRLTRRRFLQAGAAASAALAAPAYAARPPARADRLRIAAVGVAGQGTYNIDNVAQEEIVALVDVDQNRAA